MRAALDRLTAPVFARLPDLTSVPPRRQMAGGIIASIVLHLLVLLGIALVAWLMPDAKPTFAGTPPSPTNDLEVQIMSPDEEEPPPAANPEITPTFDRKGLEKSEEAPENPRFQSDENMVAGTERAGQGLEPLPSQGGVDLPFTEFKNQAASLGKSEADAAPPAPEEKPTSVPPLPPLYQPQPLRKQYLDALARIESGSQPAGETAPIPEPAKPMPEPIAEEPPPETKTVEKPAEDQIAVYAATATPAPKPAPATPEPERIKPVPIPPEPRATPPPRRTEELAMLTTPPPRPQPRPDAVYQPETRQTRIEGAISNRGRPGVDAVKTPLGVYKREVSAQIQARWLYWTKKRMDLLSLGTVRVRFFISQEGQVQNVQIVSNDSNQTFANVCEQSVREAEIRPPPADLGMMRDGRMELVFSFTLYDL